jgi:hypothetical protein
MGNSSLVFQKGSFHSLAEMHSPRITPRAPHSPQQSGRFSNSPKQTQRSSGDRVDPSFSKDGDPEDVTNAEGFLADFFKNTKTIEPAIHDNEGFSALPNLQDELKDFAKKVDKEQVHAPTLLVFN